MLSYETWQEPEINFEIDETYKGALNVLNGAMSSMEKKSYMLVALVLKELY